MSDGQGEIQRRDGAGPAPLSFAQELLWLMDRAAPGLSAWNVPRALRLRGELDVAALQRAFDTLVERHEVLRTVFAVEQGEPRQIVRPAAPVHVETVDVSGAPAAAQAAEVDRLARVHALAPFDLAADSLLRVLLIRVGAAEHVLCINTHHIVSDGWSKSVMFREISAAYSAARSATEPALPALPIQFADYAVWERDARHEAALAAPLAYWREKLAGPLPTLALPADFAAPTVPTFEGARRTAVLPATLVARLRDIARANDATLYMVLLAAYVATLYRFSGQDDVIVGSPIVGRMQPETDDLIGYFANTLVLRTSVEGDPTFAELLGRVRDTALGAYDNQDVPFEKLVLELQKGRQLTHAPLFQCVLTMEDTVPGTLALDGLTIEHMPVAEGATKFDLTMLVAEQPDGLRLSLWYRTDLFAAPTVERILAAFQVILEAAAADVTQRVADIRIVAPTERSALLSLGAGASLPQDSRTVLDRFEDAARRNPDVVAARSAGLQLTYRDVDARATALATRLAARGVRHGDVVGIALERGVHMVVAILGAWKAGAAYLPIAANVPRARVATYLAAAASRHVIADAARAGDLPADVTVIATDGTEAGEPGRLAPAGGDDAAYVLFTSGSTGVPKAVRVTHRNLAHYVGAISDRLELGNAPSLTFASVSPLGADLGNTSIFPALATGGTLDLVPDDVAMHPARFAEYMERGGIDVLKITPNHLRALVAGKLGSELARALPRRWLVLGGEAFTWDLADAPLDVAPCRILNHYGPTETTVGACTFELTRASAAAARSAGAATVPIGRPLPDTACYVLDHRGRLAPAGVIGELYIGGGGVADGYVGQPELTAERFVADPFASEPGARMYRTGDRARWRADGVLEFLGRADDQIKIRGFRVELGEIEHALAGHPGVEHAAAVVTRDDEPRLIAYVVARRETGYASAHAAERRDARALPADVTRWLADRLPDYMVPAETIVVEALPLGTNGKLDRRVLASAEWRESANGTGQRAQSVVAPETETEAAIAKIWHDVLQRDAISVDQSFLDLGGHSLLAIRVLGRLSKQFGVRLPLRTLFEAPTIRGLAAVVDRELREAEQRELEALLTSIENAPDAGITGAPHAPVKGEGA
jgi:amino acid adenylation domain-containing protein